ncbi:hypothetical protein TRFO_36971 [Tritrichomonas foetus]|uniref:Right handed beta helix domain-containing protein n=1 Tax=Tritrichomonas foetus TaxID=1144522 RepID=A0A1J4JER1_9EUKA|nr:hypothetical protein TRFO_36971 [Tritrichomonas foetus]|eukprot:OHS96783.1 hypothetical protein TRFO_36971 [Tritrichomonas foetus]
MDDLPHLISMLRASPPPLSADEEATIERIKKALDQGGLIDYTGKERCVPPEFTSIPEQQSLSAPNPAPAPATLFETSNVINVGPNGQYPTINSAITSQHLPEECTIIVAAGTYTEEVNVLTSVHLVAQGEVRLVNCHFVIRAPILTFRGFSFLTDGEIFAVNRGQLSLMDCRIDSTGTKAPFDLTANVSIEVVRTQINAATVLQSRNMCSITFVESTLNGCISVSKSDTRIINSQLDGRNGIALEMFSATVNVVGSTFSGCTSVALSARERTQLSMDATTISDVNGAGMLIHGFSSLRGNNIRIVRCQKAGIIISNDANATVSESSVTHCGHTGCEILNSGSLELNGVWVASTTGSAILCDGRSKLNMTRCRVTKGMRHGIEAGNGSVLRISDTMVDLCEFSGIISSNAKVTAISCLIENNKDTNMSAEDHSWVELTRCSFLKSQTDGLVADSETMIICNDCFFIENEGRGIIIRNCRDSKFQQSTFYDNKHGGLLFEDTKQMVVDNCVVNKNSFIISNVGTAIVRLSALYYATTKYGDEPREHIEVRNKSKATFEENKISKSCTKVKKSDVNIRQNKFSLSQNYAIVGEYYAKIFVESNEFNKDKMILSLKDNSYVHCFNNKISNVMRPLMKDPVTQQFVPMPSENKVKALHIRSFSEGLIEGNMISGDYDYAIFVDGQSKVDNRANQIQCGQLGGICYSGVSSGLCEDNQYTGNTMHAEFFSHGCSPTRR